MLLFAPGPDQTFHGQRRTHFNRLASAHSFRISSVSPYSMWLLSQGSDPSLSRPSH